VSFIATTRQDRTQCHHARLAGHITPHNRYGCPTPLAPIDGVVQAPGTITSDLDIFWLLGVQGLCPGPLALFLPRMPKGAAPVR
jgi:MFS transporter, DHA2 family, multidrug resistance protein